MPVYKMAIDMGLKVFKATILLLITTAFQAVGATREGRLCDASARYAKVAQMEKEAGVSIEDATGIMMLGLSHDTDMKSLNQQERGLVLNFVVSTYKDVYSNKYQDSTEASSENKRKCLIKSREAEDKVKKNGEICNNIAKSIFQINSIKMLGDDKEKVRKKLMLNIYEKERLNTTESIIDFVYSNEITNDIIQNEYLRCIKGEQ